MMASIREQFVEACIEAFALPGESAEIQSAQRKMALNLAHTWIECDGIEYRLFKAGISVRVNEVSNRLR